MEILLLGIYSFFAWLIFFKFRLLPWNIVSQVITITIPIIGITCLILFLNIYAPSSHDVRVVNYVVPINARVNGLVTEVPIEPNRPVKKGQILFKIDPVPYEIEVQNYEAQLAQLKVQLITAEAGVRSTQEQLKSATGKKEATAAKLELARLRVKQLKELADTGAGNHFDYEQAQADVANLEGELASAAASESQVRETLSGKTPEGEQDTVANIKAQIAKAEAQLANAKWNLSPDHLPGTCQRHGGGADPAPRSDGGAVADGAGDELHRGRTVDPRHLQPERGAGGQAGPGGGDRLQDVPGPDRQVQGRFDHVGDSPGAVADRQHEH